jgi:hypothetical protein
MKKNSRLYIWIETDLKNSIEEKAKEEKVSINEYCRKRLRESSESNKTDIMLKKVLNILENRKVYKGGCIK